MKKHFLAVLALGFFLGLSAFFIQAVINPKDAQAASPAVVISVFDVKVYNSGAADASLVENAGIIEKEFYTAVSKGLLPFSVSVADEKAANLIIDNLETDVCGGVDKCDSKAFVATYSATGTTATTATTAGLIISVFDPSFYDAKTVDNILNKEAGVAADEFYAAVDKGLLPFIVKITDQTEAQRVMEILEGAVCGGVGKCDNKYFVMSYGASGGSCLSIEYVNDKVYPVTDVDTYLVKQGLIKEGELVNAFKAGSLPFIITNSNQTTMDALETEFCGGVGKCESTNLLVKLGDCSGSGSGTTPGTTPDPEVVDKTQAIAVAIAQKNEMLASFNSCQKTSYANLENLSKQYVANVRDANTNYFSAMAPVTAQFIRDFRAATTELTKQTLIEAYRSSSISNRSKLYVDQTATFTKFISDYSSAKTTFEACK